MSSSISFNIINRKAKKLAMQLPIKYTFAELSAAETAVPGTMAGIIADIGLINAAFQGALKVQDGNYAGWVIGFSTPTTAVVPTLQTHEERVVLTYECQFPNAVTELHKCSVPTPDLLVDWPFPAGADRVYAADINTYFSATATALTDNIADYLLAHGYDGVTSVTLLYVDLVGKNS